MVTVYVEAKGQEAVMNVIADMAARGANTRPLMGTVGHIILGSVTRNFEAEGRPNKWKPISSLTEEIYSGRLLDRLLATKGYQKLKQEKTKKAHQSAYITKNGGKLLQRSGDLRKSIVIGKLSNNSVEIGSSLLYARIHQMGGEIIPKKAHALMVPLSGDKFLLLKKVTIPARTYLMMQKEDEIVIIKATKDYLQQAAVHAESSGNKYWR